MSGAQVEATRGRALRRIVALAPLALLALAAAAILLSGDGGHRYRLVFETGGQLVPGNLVQVGGHKVGTVEEITLTDEALAEVEIEVSEPLHEGTLAAIRSTSLSGIANRYVSLHPGPNSEPELDDGSTIPAERTSSPVDLDQLFNTFDRPTRAALRDFIRGQATVYTGNNEEARETYRYFAPSLQQGQRLVAELNRDERVLSEFFVAGARAFGAIAERRDDLSALTANANDALGAVARENASLARALDALPDAMRQGNTTFVNLRAALDDLDPLVADLDRVAPELPGFLRDVRPVARGAVPVVGDLRAAVNRQGADNDLADALRDLPRAERSASATVPLALDALADSRHIFEFARPYSPDLLALVGKLGASAGYYDLNGHFIRAQPAGSNIFDLNEVTGVLEAIPMSQMFDAYAALGTGPFTRCPGGATQPNAGWPVPTDHPFLDDGALDGECDPSDVPPGP